MITLTLQTTKKLEVAYVRKCQTFKLKSDLHPEPLQKSDIELFTTTVSGFD